jgi:hypothetical protein
VFWSPTMADEKKKPDQGVVGCIAILLVAMGVLYSRCAADKAADPDGRTPEKVAEDARAADEAGKAARTATVAPPTQEAPRGLVTAAEFGDRWPFTVAEGTLHCLAGGGRPVVFFTTDDRRYAINGNARDLVDGTAIRDSKEIEKKTKPGVSVQPLIARALQLCPK